MNWYKKYLLALFLCLSVPLLAQESPQEQNRRQELLQLEQQAKTSVNANPSLTTKLVVLAGLSLMPFAVMLLTSFMKIIVVLSLFRQALGVQQSPPNQVLVGIALLMTVYIMFPTGLAMYKAAEPVVTNVGPVGVLSGESASFLIEVVEKSKEPLRDFLQRNSSPKHMKSFYLLAYKMFPEPFKTDLKQNDIIILVPSFITSQLKAAFEIGVLIYLPFFVIDLVVSNILLAMGMMMLSPLTIALPIKLLLLVMIDGWTILVQGLALSFR
ncbi:MAG: type III secretion system export apparatus subunit SctR [Chlamydiales bacterium]|nr:type III secretion system export apparatus subunit SctR [Chlamydiales bacterium]